MTHSSRKKIWAGALAALLALFAAVVVATPAVADPAEEMSPAITGGWQVVATGTSDAPTGWGALSGITSATSTGITISPVAGEDQDPITINLNAANSESTPITFENLGTITGQSSALITINGTKDTYVNFNGGNVSGSAAVLAITNTAGEQSDKSAGETVGVVLGGSGTLTLTNTSSASAMTTSTGAVTVTDSLNVVANVSGGTAGALALGDGPLTIGDGDGSTATVTLNNTGSGPAFVAATDTNTDENDIKVNEGATLACTVAAPNGTTAGVQLNDNNLQVDGTVSVELTGTGNMPAVSSTGAIALGAAGAPASNADFTVSAQPNATSLGGSANAVVTAGSIANYGGTVAVDVTVSVPAGATASNYEINGVQTSTATGVVVANGGTMAVNVVNGGGKGLTTTNSGVVTVGNGSGNSLTAGALSVNAPGVAITSAGLITLNSGEITATSGTTTAIVASAATTSVTLNGGTLTANGGAPAKSDSSAGYGISSTGNITLTNNSESGNGGPTLNASTKDTDRNSQAVNGAIAPDATGDSSAANYKWVYVSGGTNTTTAPSTATPQPVLPMEIRNYAGMATEPVSITAENLTQVIVMPNAITGFIATVSPASGSFGATGSGAGGAITGAPMPNGYVVANTGTVTKSTDVAGIFAYSAKMAPSFTDTTYPLADNVAGAEQANVTSIFNGINSGTNPTVVTVASGSKYFALTNKFSGTTLPLTLATTNAPALSVTGLYPKNSLKLTMNEIPVSYQVTFDGNGRLADPQPEAGATVDGETVTDANKGAFGYTIATPVGSEYGVYFTEPGGDTILNGIPSITDTSKNVPVASLPVEKPVGSYFLGWYESNTATDATVPVLPDPITEVPTASANVTYNAVYGKVTVNTAIKDILDGSPQTIMAGETATYTVPVKVVLANTDYYSTLDISDINLDPQAINVTGVVDSDSYVSLQTTFEGASSGALNGVVLGTPTVSDVSEAAFVITVPITTGANATQGKYSVGIAINEAGTGDTTPSSLYGILNVDGVAADADIAVIRYYNPYDGEHVLTTSHDESMALLTAGWLGEDIAWFAPADGQAVYRLYNPYNHDHYYTTSTTEVDGLVELGWEKDFANADGTQNPVFYGNTENSLYPVYQLFNPYETVGTHLWTLDMNEVLALCTPDGWQNEGPKWFASYPGTTL